MNLFNVAQTLRKELQAFSLMTYHDKPRREDLMDVIKDISASDTPLKDLKAWKQDQEFNFFNPGAKEKLDEMTRELEKARYIASLKRMLESKL